MPLPETAEPLLETTDGNDCQPLSALVADIDDVDEPDADGHDHTDTGTCAICGLGGLCWPITGTHGVFSNSFTSDDALGRGDGVCYRCRYLAKAMDYRRYHWVASEETGVEVIKKRPRLIEVLLDPPEGPWMVQYKDGSDFLTVLNGWIYAQQVNHSRERYRLLVDKRMVDIERETFAEMIDFGRGLRARDDPPAKRTLLHGPTPADFGRYDIGREDYDCIVGRNGHEGYVGREDWRIAVQLIE